MNLQVFRRANLRWSPLLETANTIWLSIEGDNNGVILLDWFVLNNTEADHEDAIFTLLPALFKRNGQFSLSLPLPPLDTDNSSDQRFTIASQLPIVDPFRALSMKK